MMSTEPAAARPRRIALVLAAAGAAPATPPGVDPDAFTRACLVDAYEVVADLVGVTSGIIGPPSLTELLWPGGLLVEESSLPEVIARLTGDFDELVLVPADVPDLPGLVLAKLFKVLHRVDLAVARERHGPGCAALGIALPTHVAVADVDLDLAPTAGTFGAGVRIGNGPDWHRLRTPADVDRLDPGLEGWEETRALLSGRALGVRRTGG